MKGYRFLTHVDEEVREALSLCDRTALFYKVIGVVGADAFDEAVKKTPNHDFAGALSALARKNTEVEKLLLPSVAINNFMRSVGNEQSSR